VRWWLYGGDDKINAYVEDVVAPAARELGVQIRRVPVTDTADALQRVVAERRAGKTSGGAVDLIWINGENFATGKQAGLWLRGWARGLPNARRYVDQGDPAISRDSQVSVDGQKSPWQRAAFVYAYDSAKLKAPPQDLDALLAYAKAHPGRVTYPGPPDFTGSAFVRQRRAGRGQSAAEPAAAGGQARPGLPGQSDRARPPPPRCQREAVQRRRGQPLRPARLRTDRARDARRPGRAAGAAMDAGDPPITAIPALLRRPRVRDCTLLAPAALTIIVLFGGALVGTVRTSVLPLGGHVTLHAWRALVNDSGFTDAATFTLRTAALSTLLAALVALAVALSARSSTRVRALLALPVPVPHLLVASVAILWLAPGGLAERLLGGLPVTLVRDRAGLGIVLVYVYKEAPFLVLLLLASMGQAHRERDEAAAALGVSPSQRLRWVTWPTIRGPLVVDALSTTVHAYPTLAEGPSRAADERLRQKYAGRRYRALARRSWRRAGGWYVASDADSQRESTRAVGVRSTRNRIAPRRVRRSMTAHATFNGQTIADSDHTIVVEGNHYFPVDDVRDDLFHATSSRTLCPWKGIANYWTVEVDGVRAKDAAWGYRRPWPLARRVKGRIAFWNGVAVHAD